MTGGWCSEDGHSGCLHKQSIGEGPSTASLGHTDTVTTKSTCGLSQLDFSHENASIGDVDGTAKKKRVSRTIGGGLRHFSVIVCKILESKGSTTYSEVADEIIAEFATSQNDRTASFDEFNEKNVRRRVYDALNVLMALDIITKEKKEIRWKGRSSTCMKNLEEIKALCNKLMTRIEKKAAYLKDLEEQIAGLKNLMVRNQQLLKNSNSPSEGLTLPFLLVQTSSHSTIEIEISEDKQLVHCDFNSTPFSLHDDAYVLKSMRYYQLPESR